MLSWFCYRHSTTLPSGGEEKQDTHPSDEEQENTETADEQPTNPVSKKEEKQKEAQKARILKL